LDFGVRHVNYKIRTVARCREVADSKEIVVGLAATINRTCLSFFLINFVCKERPAGVAVTLITHPALLLGPWGEDHKYGSPRCGIAKGCAEDPSLHDSS